MAVAWQSAIKLRWRVLLLITANNTLPLRVYLCPLPSLPLMMCSRSHLFYSICSASNTLKASISLTHQLTYFIYFNVQCLCKRFAVSVLSAGVEPCDLSWQMICVKVCGCFAEVKLSMYDWYDPWPGWATFVQGSCVVKSHTLVGFLGSAFSNGHAVCCSMLHLETTRNKGQESSWGVLSKLKVMCFSRKIPYW